MVARDKHENDNLTPINTYLPMRSGALASKYSHDAVCRRRHTTSMITPDASSGCMNTCRDRIVRAQPKYGTTVPTPVGVNRHPAGYGRNVRIEYPSLSGLHGSPRHA